MANRRHCRLPSDRRDLHWVYVGQHTGAPFTSLHRRRRPRARWMSAGAGQMAGAAPRNWGRGPHEPNPLAAGNKKRAKLSTANGAAAHGPC